METKVRGSAPAPLKAGHVFEEFARTLWYLRAPLAALFVLFLLLSAVMYYADGPIEVGSGTPPSFWNALYFCIITALTIGYGDVVPTTIVGRIDSVLIGVQGVLVTSMVTAAFVHAVQEAARHAGTQDDA
ncbi:voltage-gated potassium channel [Paraburkholderia atlantica]|uniref:potassium channel family protein n=1 Tax=Paraburkholderia atlantica TaxID=2654982 RepID=UPI003D1CE809